MKQQILLKEFEYSIPASSMVLAHLKQDQIIAEHLPLMKVAVDFETGLLKLEGDWRFMMASNKHNKASWFACHRERVKIETAIYPALAINLDDPESDGLIFPLEGVIKDGNTLSSCSGLLVFDKTPGGNDLVNYQWEISFYLYDSQFDDCEIKFKLPVDYAGMNAELN